MGAHSGLTKNLFSFAHCINHSLRLLDKILSRVFPKVMFEPQHTSVTPALHQRHTSVTPASHQRHSIVCFFWRSPSCEFFGVQPGSPTSLGESSYVVLTRRGQHQECTSMLVSIIPLSPAAV